MACIRIRPQIILGKQLREGAYDSQDLELLHIPARVSFFEIVTCERCRRRGVSRGRGQEASNAQLGHAGRNAKVTLENSERRNIESYLHFLPGTKQAGLDALTLIMTTTRRAERSCVVNPRISKHIDPSAHRVRRMGVPKPRRRSSQPPWTLAEHLSWLLGGGCSALSERAPAFQPLAAGWGCQNVAILDLGTSSGS
jgi:hypothetical protein